MNIKQLVLLINLAAALTMAHVAFAAGGAVELKSVVEVDKVIVNKDGTKETKRMPAKKVSPDGEVIYTTTFKNVIDKPVGNIVINNGVPQYTRYVVGSATGANTDITFSVDGGKTYTTEDKLSVTTKEGKVRPAVADDYTNIRWSYKGDLPAAQTGTLVFKAVVK